VEKFVIQNLVSITYTDEQLAAADAAITQLETIFANFISLTPDERRSLNRMGQQSRPFCENTLLMMDQNPELIPPYLDREEAKRDLLTRSQLVPLLNRLERLAERGSDTEDALGSDVMMLCLAGYGALDRGGVAQGLDSLRKQLSVRFARKRRTPAEGKDDEGGNGPASKG
jgi:hypothetical protein